MNDCDDGECIFAPSWELIPFKWVVAGAWPLAILVYFNANIICAHWRLATKYPILSKNIKTELYWKLLVINLRCLFIWQRHRLPSAWHGRRMRNEDPINRRMQLHTPSIGGAAMKFSFLLFFFCFPFIFLALSIDPNSITIIKWLCVRVRVFHSKSLNRPSALWWVHMKEINDHATSPVHNSPMEM